MAMRAPLMLVGLLAVAGCKAPPLQITVKVRTSASGVAIDLDANRPTEDVYCDALNLSHYRGGRHHHFDVPWDKIPDRGDGSGKILVVARVDDGMAREEIVIAPADVKGGLKPQPVAAASASGGGAPASVAVVAAPSEETPIVLLDAAKGGGYKLTGTLGERLDVEVAPLKLTFAATPTASLAYHGKPLPFDKGRAELVIDKRELVLDTPPADLAATTHKPWLKLTLAQQVGEQTKEHALYLEPAGGGRGTDLAEALLPVVDGTPLPFAGARQGGVLLYSDEYTTRALVVGGPSQTRALVAVGIGKLLPRSGGASKVCRYSGGYSESYYRRDVKLIAYSAATGKKLGEKLVAGKPPRSCPFSITTFGNSKTGSLSSTPSDAEITAAFRQLGRL